MRLILFNKPFEVLPQFTSPDGRRCLRDYVHLADVYPAGRLDYDSEGLMLLTDFGPWQARTHGTLRVRNDSRIWNVRDVVLTSEAFAAPVFIAELRSLTSLPSTRRLRSARHW